MSYSQMKSWSKNELKNRLLKMGISIDKNEHDKSYYEKLYLEQMNAKNKFTRNNNYFGRKQLLNIKRERLKEDLEYILSHLTVKNQKFFLRNIYDYLENEEE